MTNLVDMKMSDFLTVFLTNRGEVYTLGDNIDS